MDSIKGGSHRVVGEVDTHKGLHIAAVVDERDRAKAMSCSKRSKQFSRSAATNSPCNGFSQERQSGA